MSDNMWSIANTNIKNSFRIVNASFLAYLKPDRHYRFNEKYLDLWIKITQRTYDIIYNLSKQHFSKINPDFNIGLDGLENPLTTNKAIEFYLDKVSDKIELVSNNYEKGGIFITDSGGLQLFRAKLGLIKDNPSNIEKKLYDTVFPLQSRSNFAMAFDHIVTDFTYASIKENAIKTANSIREQIKIFDDLNGRASLLPIFSPVVQPDAIDLWSDVLIDNLPWDSKRLHSGIAFGGIMTYKNDTLPLDRAFYIIALLFKIENKLKKIFGKDYKLPFAHLLGMSYRRNVALLMILPLLKKFNVLSMDGRSYVMSFVVGKCSRYRHGNHLITYSKIGKGNTYKNLMLESLIIFEDLIRDYFEIKDLNEIIRLSIEYFDKTKRNDLNTSCFELLLTVEAYTSIIHSLMKIIHDMENYVDKYLNIIEYIANDPNHAFEKFKSAMDSISSIKNDIDNCEYDIHELI